MIIYVHFSVLVEMHAYDFISYNMNDSFCINDDRWQVSLNITINVCAGLIYFMFSYCSYKKQCFLAIQFSSLIFTVKLTTKLFGIEVCVLKQKMYSFWMKAWETLTYSQWRKLIKTIQYQVIIKHFLKKTCFYEEILFSFYIWNLLICFILNKYFCN